MVGATGKYASLVAPKLKQRGVTVRALVRNNGNALVLRAILGREPRTMQQYIEDLANRKATT